MSTISEVFIVAFRQYSNQISYASASRAAVVITNSLANCLSENERRNFFSLLPIGLAPSSNQFGRSLRISNKFSLSTKPREQIARYLSLTDDAEVENLICAYFKAIKEIVEPSQSDKIARYLYGELRQVYLRA